MGSSDGFVVVDGAALIHLMAEANLEIKELARRCDVTDQTVRNYRKSTIQASRRADSETLREIAAVLQCASEELILGGTTRAFPECYYDFATRSGIADPTASKFPSLAGMWQVSVTLDPAFDSIRPWNVDSVVEFQQESGQNGPVASVGFSVELLEDCRRVFDGCLTEAGNVLQGCYQFLEGTLNPKHGHLMALCFGDEVKGHWIGRNPKSGYGIIHGGMEARRVKSGTGSLVANPSSQNETPGWSAQAYLATTKHRCTS